MELNQNYYFQESINIAEKIRSMGEYDAALLEGKRPAIGVNEARVFLGTKLKEALVDQDNEKANQSICMIADETHANDLVRLHNIVYDGYYPYTEMLDKDYVEDFLSTRKKSKVAIFKPRNKDEFCGCAISMIDLKKRTMYMRGLMMDPAYRGKIDIKNLLSDAICTLYNDYENRISKVYTECRTTHTIAQFMMNYVGQTPVGIFPSKDIFFGPGSKRESDVLMVAHYEDAFENRNRYHALLPEFSKIYDFMANTFNLNHEPDYFDIEYDFTIEEITKAYKIYMQIQENKVEGEYNRLNYSFTTPSNSKLSFTVTKTVDSAEEAEFTAVEPVEIMALLMKLEEVIIRDDIKYFEIYMPAVNPENQRLMLDMGFNVFGYVPAWHENNRGQFEDCIIFGLVKEKVKKKDIKLIGSASSLLRRLKPFMKNAII